MLLYKRTAIGIYEMDIQQFSSKDCVSVSYGLIGGKKVTVYVDGAKKYNSILLKRRKEGYKTLEDIGYKGISSISQINAAEIDFLLGTYNTDINNYFKSMKCKPFVPDYFDYGSFNRPAKAQPKINGNRGTATWGEKRNGLFTTQGVILKSHEGIDLKIAHIEKAFEQIFAKCSKDIAFDGEFYVRNEPVTSISGACRNPRNPIHSRLNYHCFDLAIPDIPQTERLIMKHDILKSHEKPNFVAIQRHPSEHNQLDNYIIIDVVDQDVHSDMESSDYRDLCLDSGYEGCVIRNAEANYRFGSRPMTMMKLKKPHFTYLEVIDIKLFGFENNSSNDVGKGATFILRNDTNNLIFDCNATGTIDQKLNAYNNRNAIKGTKVLVKYYERSATGKPFHANVILDE